MEAVKSPVMLYTEQTPNPETLKFVTNKMLYRGTADFRDPNFASEWSPLASALFAFPYVKGVYICNNFVTITKEFNYGWEDVMLNVKEFIKAYVTEANPIINEGFESAMAAKEAEANEQIYSGDDGELVRKIKDLIDTYVKPAVESDGGNIEFKSYHNGVVTVIMQGSCSGCPSSTVTLKSGIEGMLKRMIPEVQEVVSEMG
ncbi:MAG TPA: NifU family protein [Saprospiraceae bacterium]|nr:NifU family protein [Saprospiraceae bacterium]MBK8826279.1 NifU family protein [Saprospiraceae bacterium]MBK9580639.1 NifU family protein [Saprospiraceae bacterium]HQV65798.1 NifU family protein [Saprospiraceae bacterium]HRG42206.1 NifU family protein [Saprospiraceae bacterium]